MQDTIYNLLAYQANHRGHLPWLISDKTDAVISWRDGFEKTCQIATNLIAAGLEKGQAVAIGSVNSSGAVLAFMAVVMAGGRAVPLNLVSGEKTLHYVVRHAKVQFAILTDEAQKLCEHALAGSAISCLRLDGETGPELSGKTDAASAELATRTKPEDIAMIMYTSGTTGTPKGVLHSQASLLASGENVVIAHQLSAADRTLCILPIYHINGLCVSVMSALICGGSIVLVERFSASRFWSQIIHHRASWFSAVPTLFAYILNDDKPVDLSPEPIRFARSASAPLPPEIHRKFEARFGLPIIETMGLTETGSQILSNPMPPEIRKIGSAGKEIGNRARIINPHTLAPMPDYEEGEIVVKGNNVMKGYLDQPEETDKTITKDGWLRTGDLGHRDKDGFFFVTGRIKELIIKGGENITPREIDEVLLEHDAVLEAAAFARPCDNYGQIVAACVRLKSGRTISQAELLAHCHKQLGQFKSPDDIFFLDQLPKGPSGKVQRLKLHELVSAFSKP